MKPASPYYVLEVGCDATPGEIERQGRKILGLIEVGAEKGATYECPLGVFARDATMVREAIATLRDPKKRVREACLIGLVEIGPALAPTVESKGPRAQIDAPLQDAFAAIGYRGL